MWISYYRLLLFTINRNMYDMTLNKLTSADLENEVYFIEALEHNSPTDTRDTAIVACNRLQAVHLQDSRCDDGPIYAETYNINVNLRYTNASGKYAQNSVCAHSAESDFDMSVEYISYFLCSTKSKDTLHDDTYGTKRRFIKLWHNDLLPYNVRESLLFSLSGDPQHMLNIIGNAHGIIKPSNVTTRFAVLQYMSQLQEFNYSRLSATKQSPLIVNGVFLPLHEVTTQNWSSVILHVAHDCYKYCGRSEIYVRHIDDIMEFAMLYSDNFFAHVDHTCVHYMRGIDPRIPSVFGDFTLAPQDQPFNALSYAVISVPVSFVFLVTSFVCAYTKEISAMCHSRGAVSDNYSIEHRN